MSDHARMTVLRKAGLPSTATGYASPVLSGMTDVTRNHVKAASTVIMTGVIALPVQVDRAKRVQIALVTNADLKIAGMPDHGMPDQQMSGHGKTTVGMSGHGRTAMVINPNLIAARRHGVMIDPTRTDLSELPYPAMRSHAIPTVLT